MNTIQALENDIYSQVKCLNNFLPQKPLSESKQKRAIFCGSGDSLAAAMLAEAHSGLLAKAADPLDIIKNKHILYNRDVYVISVSGKTISNIKVAQYANRAIAITSNKQSKLAKAASKIILLRFPNSDVVTAGSISFLDAALTCISLIKTIRLKNVKKIFDSAINQARKINLGQRIYYLGNLYTYPLALYGAAKIYEVLGLDASYERIEQFSHMELFAVRRGATVIIYESENKHNSQLHAKLKKVGLNVIQPIPPYNDAISQFLFYTFFSQLVPLLLAKKNHQTDCHFVTAKKLRKISDEMIY